MWKREVDDAGRKKLSECRKMPWLGEGADCFRKEIGSFRNVEA